MYNVSEHSIMLIGGFFMSEYDRYDRYDRDDRDDRDYDQRYMGRVERRRRERLKRRRRNRIMIVSGGILILAVLILIIVLLANSCASCAGSSDVSAQSATEATELTAATEAPTQPATEDSSVTQIADNGEEGYVDGSSGLYFWDNKAFELFYGNDDAAKNYAAAINRYKNQLGSAITVYDMVVPNHSEFGLCPREEQRLTDEQGVTSQRQNTTTVYSNLDSDVKTVDIYDTMNKHKTEYLYFNTDHHWTGLGAYYAYTAFAQAAGLEPMQLEAATKNTIDGFLGSLYTASQAEVLQQHPDHVDYYTLPGNYSCTLFMDGSDEPTYIDNMYYEAAEAGSGTYGVFIWGDNPLMVIDNEDNSSGDKIAIVKESYGNAFAPYLAYNYDEVHIIDFRYFDGNLKDYCDQYGIKNVLFLNGIMSANTGVQIETMNGLFDTSGAGPYDLGTAGSDSSEDGAASSDDYSYSGESLSGSSDSSTDYGDEGYYSDDYSDEYVDSGADESYSEDYYSDDGYDTSSDETYQ